MAASGFSGLPLIHAFQPPCALHYAHFLKVHLNFPERQALNPFSTFVRNMPDSNAQDSGAHLLKPSCL